jgi:hypothetical protein
LTTKILVLVTVIIGGFGVSDAFSTSAPSGSRLLYRHIQELPINPNFAPDQSYFFNAYQLKCIPGEQQVCSEGFGGNDDGTCFAKTFINGKWEWECPEGYHSTEDDETGQCYPDTEPCYPGNLSSPDTTNCSKEESVCKKFNMTGCMVNGGQLYTSIEWKQM